MLRFVKGGQERLKQMRQTVDGYMILYMETGIVLYSVRGMEIRQSFVEEDRVQVWATAYNSYFNGDMVTAGHLLMPQVEHALHNLLEEIVEDVTKLDQEVQKEPTLSGILTQLKSFCNPTLYDELNMFLIDGNDVNYRNNLLHGLMWSMDMLRYGHYLFYVANLLYFNGRKFLAIGGDEMATN